MSDSEIESADASRGPQPTIPADQGAGEQQEAS